MDEVGEALRDHAVGPFDSSPAGELGRDVRDRLADVPPLNRGGVVGLGEATHGTREFQRWKHLLLRYLVEERGFRTICFETPVTATYPLDEYVRNGDGDPTSVLSRLDAWQWRTEAVRSLLAWLRSFNECRPDEDRVRVRGIDLRNPAVPASELATVVERLAPPTSSVRDAGATLRGADSRAGTDREDASLDAVEAAVDAIETWLETDREAIETEHQNLSWTRVRHRCRTVEQACAWQRIRRKRDGPHAAGMAARDRYLAENVAWARRQETGNGVAILAHNGHVQRGTFDDGQIWTDVATMGERLHREFRDEYVPIGFDFGRGSFRAIPAGGDARQPATFAVGAPIEESATRRVAAISTETARPAAYAIDLDGASSDSRLESWLSRRRAIRRIGSVFDPAADPTRHYQRTALPTAYDALVFVDRSDPTRPIRDS